MSGVYSGGSAVRWHILDSKTRTILGTICRKVEGEVSRPIDRELSDLLRRAEGE